MMAHLHRAGGEDTLSAIQGGKGIRELVHTAADGGEPLHQNHLMTAVGDIEGGLHAADPTSDDHSPSITHFKPLLTNRGRGST